MQTKNIQDTFAWLKANGFMCTEHKACCMSVDVKTEISRAFDRGNYAGAYKSHPEISRWNSRAFQPHEWIAFVLGFLGTLELHEMCSNEREIYDECYWSPTGRYIVNDAGYCDSRDDDYKAEAENF